MCYLDPTCSDTISKTWDYRLRADIWRHGPEIFVPAMTVSPDAVDDQVFAWLSRLHGE